MRTGFHRTAYAACLALALSFFALNSASAQQVPPDPLCGPLRLCAQGVLPKVDDGVSPPALIAERILPLCEPQAISCNDAIVAAARQQLETQKPKNAAQVEATLDRPQNRAKIEKEIVAAVLTIEVGLHRNNAQAPGTAAQQMPAYTATPAAR